MKSPRTVCLCGRIEQDRQGGLRFKAEPVALFEEKKSEISATIQNTFENQGRVVRARSPMLGFGGRAKSKWKMLIRERIKAA
jgi:hypothetical protein